MGSQLLVGDGWPRSAEIAGLVSRIGTIDWFRRSDVVRDPSRRLSRALTEHAERLGTAPVSSVEVQRPWEGRAAVRGQRTDLARPTWDDLLRAPFDRARDAVRKTGRAVGHSLVLVSGDALLMRPDALPLKQKILWRRLAGPPDDRLSGTAVRILVDRVLWELGMMVVWEMVGDLLGENPYVPLLSIYEEGFYPLDLTPGGPAVLWAPQ